MRIISGKFKGKRIIAPKSLPVRPTTDMAKESLFNVLQNQYEFEGLSVLDLFAGTGNISYEFCSRGIANITAVDRSKACTHFISKTSQELGCSIEAVNMDVFKYLERAKKPFDIIFADAPFEFEESDYNKIISLVFENKLLSEIGVLILEIGAKTKFQPIRTPEDIRKYGNINFYFFEAS